MEENENNNEEEEKFDFKEEISYLKKQWIYKSIVIFIVLACIVGVASSSLTYYFTLKRKNNKFVASTYGIKDEKTSATDAIGDITEQLSTFAEVIDNQYVGEINKKTLIEETIKGFVKGLGDDYSEYFTSDEWEEFQESVLGNYSGVGIEMMQDDTGYILVTNVFEDGPAKKAGIQQGDYIIGVNGESIHEVSSQEVSNKVRGDAGTEVTLNILRNGSETLEFKLVRDNIRIYHVESKMLEDDIGYIDLLTFDSGCAKEFEEEMDSLVEQGAKKLIIDLRNNTGGDVSEALQILDLFLEKGQIEIITQSANGLRITTSSPTDRKYTMDSIVILINEYTASAAEIVTGAMIDNELAKTVGIKSYGKGVMQSVYQLLDGGALKITTQEYNTPNGTKIQGVGITPNYEVELDKNSEIDNQLEKAKVVVKGEE